MKRTLFAVAVLLAAGRGFAGDGTIHRAEGAPAIADRYIVVLNDDAAGTPDAPARTGLTVPIVAVDMAARYGGSVFLVYESALKGFAIQMPEQAAERLAADPRVDFVEQDSAVWAVATQSPATWGIDRIDQRNRPLSNSYTYNTTASNVHAYVIDTGIRSTHTQFGGRVSGGATFSSL